MNVRSKIGTTAQIANHRGIARRVARAAATVLAAWLAVACAHEARHLVAAADQPPLRVGLTFDYPPFSSGAPESPRGLDIEIARAFAASLGREIVFVQTRWPDLASDLASGRFDVALGGVTVRTDRSLVGRFSVPIVESGAVLLTPSTSSITDPDAASAAGIRIAVNAGGHLERVARSRFPAAHILPITPNDVVPAALDDGTADAVLTDTIEAPRWEKTRAGLHRIGPLTRDRKAALVRADDAATARALDAWLLQREADGALARWRRAHLGEVTTRETATPLVSLVAALDERLALMPDVARAKRARGVPVTDIAQEARVIEAASRAVKDAAAASAQRPPPDDAVRAFFEEQIALAREIQEGAASEPSPAEAGRDDTPPDLERALRPAIARISDRIAMLLVSLPANLDAQQAATSLREGIRHVAPGDAQIDAIGRTIADCSRR